MNKYFTKEYIKECDCKEIQGLRKKLQFGDIILWRLPKLEVFGWWTGKRNAYFPLKDGGADFEGSKEDKMLWLPTSDQLDEEIEKILKDKYEYYKWEYIIKCCWIGRSHPNWVCILYDKNHGDIFTEVDNNPLIAKIKLLKKLLK